jgi:pimeloyl-ACP methyl ester carboxylesterase
MSEVRNAAGCRYVRLIPLRTREAHPLSPVTTRRGPPRGDYLSWSSVQEYQEALPDARLLYLKSSGHNVYQDEPKRYLAAVRAFLLDKPLPQHPYRGHRMPENYQGPR